MSEHSTLWTEFDRLLQHDVSDWPEKLTKPLGLQSSCLTRPNINQVATLASLSNELLLDICAYLLVDDIRDVQALRSITPRLYAELTPILYRHYIPRVECWGFDGLEYEHPTYADPYVPPTDIMSIIGRAMKRSLGIWVQSESSWPMDNIEKSHYYPDSGGPRNLAWLLRMPLAARESIRRVQIYGPVPQRSFHILGPPPRWLNRKQADWYVPQRAILKWLRENMNPDIEAEYCFALGTLYSSRATEVERVIPSVLTPVKIPPYRKLMIPRSPLSYTMKDWVSPIQNLIQAGSPLRHLEIWISCILADECLGRRQPSKYPPDDIALLREIRAFRTIPGLESVRVLFHEADDQYVPPPSRYLRCVECERPDSRRSRPMIELHVDLDFDGYRTMVYTEAEEVDGRSRPRFGSVIKIY